MKTQSSSTHPRADGRLGEVTQSTKHVCRVTAKQSCSVLLNNWFRWGLKREREKEKKNNNTTKMLHATSESPEARRSHSDLKKRYLHCVKAELFQLFRFWATLLYLQTVRRHFCLFSYCLLFNIFNRIHCLPSSFCKPQTRPRLTFVTDVACHVHWHLSSGGGGNGITSRSAAKQVKFDHLHLFLWRPKQVFEARLWYFTNQVFFVLCLNLTRAWAQCCDTEPKQTLQRKEMFKLELLRGFAVQLI